MPNIGRNRPKKISERLKEIQDFIKATPQQMCYVLSINEQMYRLYLKGTFDKSYSIKQERVFARIILIGEELDKRISELQHLQMRLKNYGKMNGKFLPVAGRKGEKIYAPRKYRGRKKPVKKSVKTSTLKEQDLNGKG